jgi:hypothetical protein
VTRTRRCRAAGVALFLFSAHPALAQSLTYRGLVEVRGVVFPEDAPGDAQNLVADVLARGELFARPAPWIGFAVGLDLRANSHDQVEDAWKLDVDDRGIQRPRASIRRLTASLNRGPVTIDIGKQFIRWGKADIVTPTDRFAPRDYLNVIDADFLAVRGVRLVVESGATTIDAAWVPYLTPSRLPLFDQRWTAVPSGVGIVLNDDSRSVPEGSQAGIRVGHTAGGFESSISFYDGFNHLPTIEVPAARPKPVAGQPAAISVQRVFPRMRMYGADGAASNRWFTAKGEIAYFTSSSAVDEYVLYVLQLEKQKGEWLLIGGYAGEVVTESRQSLAFAPDRGTSKTILGRASYTIDVNRSAAVEAAVRQNGDGLYVKGEYSQARGQHWRATVTGAIIRGDADDFLGQYRQNSHAGLALRYSF